MANKARRGGTGRVWGRDQRAGFAQWLADYMTAKQLRHAEVAGRMAVAEGTVYAWLRGEGPRHPTPVKAAIVGLFGAVDGPMYPPVGDNLRPMLERQVADLRAQLADLERQLSGKDRGADSSVDSREAGRAQPLQGLCDAVVARLVS